MTTLLLWCIINGPSSSLCNFWVTSASAPIGELIVYFSHKPPKTVVGVVQTASSGPSSAPSDRMELGMGMDGMGTYGSREPCPSARTSGPSDSDIDNGWGWSWSWGWGWEYQLLHLPFFIRIRERLGIDGRKPLQVWSLYIVRYVLSPSACLLIWLIIDIYNIFAGCSTLLHLARNPNNVGWTIRFRVLDKSLAQRRPLCS